MSQTPNTVIKIIKSMFYCALEQCNKLPEKGDHTILSSVFQSSGINTDMKAPKNKQTPKRKPTPPPHNSIENGGRSE